MESMSVDQNASAHCFLSLILGVEPPSITSGENTHFLIDSPSHANRTGGHTELQSEIKLLSDQHGFSQVTQARQTPSTSDCIYMNKYSTIYNVYNIE